MNMYVKAILGASVLALAACSSTGSRDTSSGSSDDYGGTTAPASTSSTSSTATPAAPKPSAAVVYFDLDSSTLKPEGRELARAWAAYLSANPSAKVRLEGHCDERGTREYNVSLGERRGNAVLSALTAQGVSARQISVTSYGEERPVDPGHNETAWAKNRRVEIVH